jgi:hypothetical protein
MTPETVAMAMVVMAVEAVAMAKMQVASAEVPAAAEMHAAAAVETAAAAEPASFGIGGGEHAEAGNGDPGEGERLESVHGEVLAWVRGRMSPLRTWVVATRPEVQRIVKFSGRRARRGHGFRHCVHARRRKE